MIREVKRNDKKDSKGEKIRLIKEGKDENTFSPQSNFN